MSLMASIIMSASASDAPVSTKITRCVAGEEKRFNHAAMTDGDPTGNDFHAVDGNVFENTDHVLAPLKIPISDFEIWHLSFGIFE